MNPSGLGLDLERGPETHEPLVNSIALDAISGVCLSELSGVNRCGTWVLLAVRWGYRSALE